MKLEGRLTGHFLARVVLLVAALGFVFLVWLGAVAFSTLFATRQATSQPTTILRTAADITHAEGDHVTLDQQTIDALAEGGYWLQVLDENGDELAQYGRPEEVPTHYTPGGLVLYRSQPGDIGQQKLSTWVETVDGRELTFVLGASRSSEPGGPRVYLGGDESVTQPTLWALMGALLVGGAAVTIGVAWFTGRGLARPLVHMMRWLSALADGEYREPPNREGRPLSRGYDGRRHRPFATYREVFDSLDTLTLELCRTAEERERLEAAREEWIAGVTHDLRTPLTSIHGYANVLASEYEFEPEDVRRQSAVIATQAGHMDALLDDLNLSFRLRSSALPLEMADIDAIELVREAAVGLVNDPRSDGREVVFEEPPGSGCMMLHADPVMLRRVITNLLVNAAVHNPSGTRVTASMVRDTGHVRISVTDDGVGMDAETQRSLFDRYYRGTSTGQGAEGTGLGMAIARDIVQAHGGEITVQTAEGQGTTVTVQLAVSR